MALAILSALAQEQSGLRAALQGAERVEHAGREFWRGRLHGHEVVLAREFLQHDLDASPLFPRHEVPLYGRSRFATHPALPDALVQRWLALLEPASAR